jgi:hypothetical protein
MSKRSAPEEHEPEPPLFAWPSRVVSKADLLREAQTVPPAHLFDGTTYEPHHDYSRLAAQMSRVRGLMLDGVWRTLDEIAAQTGDPAQSVSARLRDLRKSKWGSWTVERRRRGDGKRGVHEYRVAGSDA